MFERSKLESPRDVSVSRIGDTLSYDFRRLTHTKSQTLMEKMLRTLNKSDYDFMLNFHQIYIPGESKMHLCFMKRKTETRCPILEIQCFPERKFSHLNFAP